MESDAEDDPFAQNTQDEFSFPSLHLDFEHVPDQFPRTAHATGPWRTAHDSFNPEIKRKLRIEDVVKEVILPFVPAKSLCRFKAVCKEWNRWINNLFFVHRQSYCFQNTSGFFYQCQNNFPTFISLDSYAYGVPIPSFRFLPEDVTIRTSCNGLVCCRSCSGDNYFICNPVNKQWLALPKSNLFHGPESAVVLAYEPSSYNFVADYELICAIPEIGEPVVRFEIFSSRSRTWRIVDTIFFDLYGSKFCGDGFYMKGFAYWETLSGKILAFDLTYELFSVFPLPALRGPEGVITKFRGELCYVLPFKLENDQFVIEVYGGMDMSPKHAFSFNFEEFVANDEDVEDKVEEEKHAMSSHVDVEEVEKKHAIPLHINDDDWEKEIDEEEETEEENPAISLHLWEKEKNKHVFTFRAGVTDDEEETEEEERASSLLVGHEYEKQEEEEEYLCALPCLGDEKFVLRIGNSLVVYDSRADKAQVLSPNTIYGGGRFVPYVNSLVPVRHHLLFSEIRNGTM